MNAPGSVDRHCAAPIERHAEADPIDDPHRPTFTCRTDVAHAKCRHPSITIRDVPDAARHELAARAAASGRSLQQYLRGELIRLVAG